MISKELLKKHFEYIDGVLIWKVPTSKRVKKGMVAGWNSAKGYRSITFRSKEYKEHRLIFLYHFGYMPKMVDHIDGNKQNNKIENLRACTNSENQWNSKTPKTNTSGVKNVSYDKARSKWLVSIAVNKKQIKVGRFNDFELAALVAEEAREKYHGEYSRS